MKLGKIVGTVVATQKNEALIGAKLLVVQDLKLDIAPASGSVVCVDSVGAGIGDVVLYVSGSSARLTEVSKDRPVDATVIAIVDTVEVEGQVVFSKGAS
jgi:microcompartment protein CcmK/EutM